MSSITSLQRYISADDTRKLLCPIYDENWRPMSKKTTIKLNNNNCTQEFIASTLNVSQSCISKFLKWWKCRRSVENLHRTGRPPKSDSRGDRRIICHVSCENLQKADVGINYKLCKQYTGIASTTTIITYCETSFAFQWFYQTENSETDCNRQG